MMFQKEQLWNHYVNNQMSCNEIAERFHCDYGTVYYWMKKYNIPRRERSLANKIRAERDYDHCIHPLKPNLSNSKELAYILGVLKGDGYAGRYQKNKGFEHRIGLKVVDRVFAVAFFRGLRAIGLNPSYRPYKGYHIVEACSKLFYDWYKSLTLDNIENFCSGDKFSFIRGFYESEGCLSGSRRENGKVYFELKMTNTDLALLSLIQRILKKLGFDFKLYKYREREVYDLRLYKQGEIGRFIDTIRPCIKTWKRVMS